MNGPEHYRRAEELLAEARQVIAPPPDFTPVIPGAPTPSELHQRAITEAHVHATLALAAATALNVPHPQGGMETADSMAWSKAASAGREP